VEYGLLLFLSLSFLPLPGLDYSLARPFLSSFSVFLFAFVAVVALTKTGMMGVGGFMMRKLLRRLSSAHGVVCYIIFWLLLLFPLSVCGSAGGRGKYCRIRISLLYGCSSFPASPEARLEKCGNIRRWGG
jgi:hypothetical protein